METTVKGLGSWALRFTSVFLRHGIQAEVGREAKRTCHAVNRLGSPIHFRNSDVRLAPSS